MDSSTIRRPEARKERIRDESARLGEVELKMRRSLSEIFPAERFRWNW
jgi:hypothetical protein